MNLSDLTEVPPRRVFLLGWLDRQGNSHLCTWDGDRPPWP